MEVLYNLDETLHNVGQQRAKEHEHLFRNLVTKVKACKGESLLTLKDEEDGLYFIFGSVTDAKQGFLTYVASLFLGDQYGQAESLACHLVTRVRLNEICFTD